MQATGLPDPVCRVSGPPRGRAEAAATPTSPRRCASSLPDPLSLKDMAAPPNVPGGRRASASGSPIFADYDVDGAASAALLLTLAARAWAVAATLYVPDRIDEGYGPECRRRCGSSRRTHDLIVCVDCGTLAHDAIAAATAADVIVLDHHLGGETLPPAAGRREPQPAGRERRRWAISARRRSCS